MRKCPFWSTNTEKVNCYNECPMYSIGHKSKLSCPFNEFLNSGHISSLGNNINDELFYSQDRYLNYNSEEKVSNY